MSGDDADELARTATAVGGSGGGAAQALATTALGRYRLEHELGAGGMGVVYAAFDPDLERRVALKVLRGSSDGTDARARLLREARAMARLTHPNVVAVYEVGSAAGRDFVAMELIDGANLADWFRAIKRGTGEVIGAFLAAGRGLAAAHAAGLIHRDFKPHNVLRAHDGRICVTDFGLARAAEVAAAVATPTEERGRADSLSGLTQTGSLLGTPAYMAPEQWRGAPVGPAADQFAYCVALWEALAGERPYRGDTLDTLRTAVERGPIALDDSGIPRRVRALLRRGLDPDAEKRWPNMDALLVALARTRLTRRRWLIGAGTLAVAAAIAMLASWPAGPGAPAAAIACAEPARAPFDVWSPLSRARVHGTSPEVAAAIDHDVASWIAVRDHVCRGDRAPARLACLDGVLAHLEVAVQAIRTSTKSSAVYDQLVDPVLCGGAVIPRLTLAASADTIAATALQLAHAGSDPLADRPGLEPCALALALGARSFSGEPGTVRRPAAQQAIDAADRCGDDRIRVNALLVLAVQETSALTAMASAAATVARATAAVERIPQADVRGELALVRAQVAVQQGELDDGVALADQALTLLIARGGTGKQLEAVTVGNTLRSTRLRAADLDAIRAAVARWRPVAVRAHADAVVRKLDLADADVRFTLGDVVGAHAESAAVVARANAIARPRDAPVLTGMVVDRAGHPVAGATVAGGEALFSDSVGIGYAGATGDVAIATTDAAGRFSLPIATAGAKLVVQAESGAARSSPQRVADGARLVLGPTARIAGHVALGRYAATQVAVYVHPKASPIGFGGMLAPVAADGAFTLDRVPVGGDVQVTAVVAGSDGARLGNLQLVDVAVRASGVTGIALAAGASSGRTLDVIARSTIAAPLDGAQILLLPAHVTPRSIDDINNQNYASLQTAFARPLKTTAASAEVGARARPGDLVVHFEDVARGELTLCAIGISGDFSDAALIEQVRKHHDMFDVRCQPLPADARIVVVDTPPMKRAN